MRFRVRIDRRTLIAFEPTGEQLTLDPGNMITVQWFGDDLGTVSLNSGDLVIWSPGDGYTRAWYDDGSEIYVGPESE